MESVIYYLAPGALIIGLLLLSLRSSSWWRRGGSHKFGLPPHNSMGSIAGGGAGFSFAQKHPFIAGSLFVVVGAGLIYFGAVYAGTGLILFALTIGILNGIAQVMPSFNKQSVISQVIALGMTLLALGLIAWEILSRQ